MSISPQNKNIFAPADLAIFEIGAGRKNTFVDTSQSYIKFGVQVSTTAASSVYLDNTAYSFIQQLSTSSSSNVLEFLNNYGDFCNYMIDHQMSKSQKSGLSTMVGSNDINKFSVAALGTAVQVLTEGDRSGQQLTTNTTLATSTCYNFCLPAYSSVWGVNSSKMLPLGALRSPLRVEMSLAALDDAVVSYAAGTSWQIVNLELELTLVEIHSDADLVDTTVPTYIASKGYRHSSTTLTATQLGEFNALLPFRFASLTAIYARFRNQSGAVNSAAATAAYRRSSSVNPNIQSYYWKIGMLNYPSKPVQLVNGTFCNNGSEGMAELMKSFHAISSTLGEPAITAQNYNVAIAASGQWAVPFGVNTSKTLLPDTFSNSFSIGQEFETFSNRSDTILSGINTQDAQNSFFVCQIAAATGVAITVDFYATFDVIFEIMDGTIRAIC